MPRKTIAVLMALALTATSTVVLAEVYDLPPDGSDVVGAVTTVTAREDDTLLDIARRHGLGYEDIVRANPDVDTWLPGEGTEVVLPTRRPQGSRESWRGGPDRYTRAARPRAGCRGLWRLV